MDIDDNVQTETRGDYTILRIKRKRTDEPLEALGASYPIPVLLYISLLLRSCQLQTPNL